MDCISTKMIITNNCKDAWYYKELVAGIKRKYAHTAFTCQLDITQQIFSLILLSLRVTRIIFPLRSGESAIVFLHLFPLMKQLLWFEIINIEIVLRMSDRSVLTMTTILAGMQDLLLVLKSAKDGMWKVHESLVGSHLQSIAFDPNNSQYAYCGTYGRGLWKTVDGGQNWYQIGNGHISSPNVTSVSVSPLEARGHGLNVVYAGTEPSEFYKSNDGGESWERMFGLNKLSSSQLWSFPPRPWTHHVRWIEPDANSAGYVFVAIEAGALIQSRDGGRTWIDKVNHGPYDSHTLATHRKARKRLYSSAGDGYFESYDYGETWNRPMNGLRHHYLYGLGVDSENPQTVIVSASLGAWQAHYGGQDAESVVYRRSDDNGEEWKIVSKGLPEPEGTMVAIIAENPKKAEEFYLASNRGIFCSTDSGVSWEALDISWPNKYLSQHAWSLAIQEEEEEG